jgi:hypothetical protein
MRHRASALRVKAAGLRFGSAPSECGRAANDGVRCGGANRGATAAQTRLRKKKTRVDRCWAERLW